MELFFKKNPYVQKELTEKHALKMIHEKIHDARKAYLDEENEKYYLKCLDEAHEMILDLFDIKGYTPTTPPTAKLLEA